MLKPKKKLGSALPILIGLPVIGLTGCSAGTTAGAVGSSISISGVLGTTGGDGSKVSLNSKNYAARLSGYGHLASVALTDLDAVCVAGSESGTSPVAADGSFSVAIPDAASKQVACSFVDGDGEVIGDMVFQDSTKKSLSGSTQVVNSVSVSSDADVGNLTLDLDQGEAVVDKAALGSALASTTVASGAAYDFTGSWTITAVPTSEMTAADVAAKYSNTLCPGGGGGGNCEGPPEGVAIYLKRVVGKDSDNNDAYAMMVWEGASSFTSCGSKLGKTYASLLTDTGIDFSGSGVTEGEFDFSTSASVSGGGTATVTDGWKLSTGTADWTMKDCGPIQVSGKNAWACTDGAGKQQISLGGGCKKDSNQQAVQPANNEWSSINNCTTTGPDSDGFYTNSCTGSISINSTSTPVTCTNTWKQDAGFDWNTVATLVTSGATCASIANNASSDKLKLTQLQCYANAYWSQRPTGACMRKIRTDFTATTSAEFLDDSSTMPESLVFANLFSYNPDGQSGGMFQREISFRGVRVSDGTNDSYVNCKVKEVGALTMAKVNDSKLKATYISTTTLAETVGAKPACDAEFANGSVRKFVFYLTK